jgi:hypothetical protein
MVRDQLLTNKQLGSTLTLTGSGSGRPTYEAALCVKAGAQFDGLTEHGLLRVVGNSCMRGPLSVQNLYGPVTVSADPLDPAPAGVQLVVQGGAQSTSLTTGLLSADEASVGVLEAGVLNTAALTVDGLLAGPLAPAVITALISNAVMVVQLNDGVNPPSIFTGIAVAPNRVLVATTTDAMTALVGGAFSAPGALKLYLPRYLGSATVVNATSYSVMRTGNVALLEFTDLNTSVYFGAEGFGSLFQDSPLPNSPMIVAYANSATGTIGFTTASVEDGFGQMFSEFTSVHVRTASPLPDGAIGGPVIDYHGKVVALVQYGTPAAGTQYGSAYATVAGGIKARFLKYFLARAPAFTSLATPVPLPVLGTYYTRPLRFTDRFADPTLTNGGASSVLAPPALSDLMLNLQRTGGETFAVSLATAGVNFPNVPEILLEAYDVASPSTNTYTVSTADPAGLATPSLFGTTAYTPYWNNGLPSGPTTPIDYALGRPVSTSMINVKDNYVSLSQVYLVAQNYVSVASLPLTFAVSAHGSASDTNIHSGCIVAWGSVVALNSYFEGIGSGGLPSTVTNTVAEAWAAAASSLSGNVFVVGGVQGSTFTFFNYPAGAAPGVQYVPFTVQAIAGNKLRWATTTVATFTPPSVVQYDFDYAGSSYQVFDYTSNSSQQSLRPTGVQHEYFASGTVLSVLSGDATTDAAPRPLY